MEIEQRVENLEGRVNEMEKTLIRMEGKVDNVPDKTKLAVLEALDEKHASSPAPEEKSNRSLYLVIGAIMGLIEIIKLLVEKIA